MPAGPTASQADMANPHGGADAPCCSVIVPSYNSSGTIAACLRALYQQDASFPYEIIVVDSSTDRTAQIVARDFPGTRLIKLAHRVGPETARNRGAACARGNILAFIDSDCVAQTDWLRRLVTRLDEGWEAIGGATANGNGETLVSWAGYLCEFREFLPGTSVRAKNYLSPNTVAYRRSVFDEAGGFPSGYYPMEDQIFHRTLIARGARVGLDATIVVAHTHRSDAAQFLEHQFRLGLANVRVLRAIGGRGQRFSRAPLLTTLLLPALVGFRFLRICTAGLAVERALMLRRPALAWLCLQGTWSWGLGFRTGARHRRGHELDRETWQFMSPTSN